MSVGLKKDIRPVLPPECSLNQPIEDSLPTTPAAKKNLAALLTAMSGFDLSKVTSKDKEVSDDRRNNNVDSGKRQG